MTYATDDTADERDDRIAVAATELVLTEEATVLETPLEAAEEAATDPEVVAVAAAEPVEAAPAPEETPGAGLRNRN